MIPDLSHMRHDTAMVPLPAEAR